MRMRNYFIIGNKREIDQLAEICRRVDELLKTKYGSDGQGKFWDWTGISIFLLFHKPYERRRLVDDEDMTGVECIPCKPWKKDMAAIWQSEIAWYFKIPTQVLQFMRQESKRLGVKQLVETLIRG